MTRHLLYTLFLASLSFEIQAQQAFAEDFVIDPGSGGFTVGTVNGQNGWQSITSDGGIISGCNVSENIPSSLTSTWEYSGTAALSITADQTFPPSDTTTDFGCFSPLLINNPVITESGTFSFMLLIDKDDDAQSAGSTYTVRMQDGQNSTSEVIFLPDGTIKVLDIIEGTNTYVDTGAVWEDHEWAQYTINYNFLQATIDYIVNGETIYQSNVLSGTNLQRFVFFHDNNQGSTAYFDNIFAFGDVALGTNNFKVPTFSLTPNPSHNIVSITTDFQAGINGVTLFDLNGRLITSDFTMPSAQLNVESLSEGIYVVKIYSDKGIGTAKLVKQ